ncbi:MAG TPA: class I SAM-dependent methyltransferase, partial [Candidatus Tripitaka californicus]
MKGRVGLYMDDICLFFVLWLLPFALLVGVSNGNEEDRSRWEERYATPEYVYGKEPVEFLKENVEFLPKGRAIVLAMGEGRNAVFLAQRGFEVEGVDISTNALEKARRLALEKGVDVRAFQADLDSYQLPSQGYDVVACFYYLQRGLIPHMKAALKPGGMIIMETYTKDNLKHGFSGPQNQDYLLDTNELLHLFSDLKVVLYREMVVEGRKAVAGIIVQ